MKFQLLGPLTVTVDGASVGVVGGRQRKILLALLLNANRTVSLSRLVEVLWGESPPRTARTQIQNCFGDLRRSLMKLSTIELSRSSSGFVLRVSRADVDTLVFEDLLNQAEDAVRELAHGEAFGLLRQALDVWRGDIAEGIELENCHGDLQHWRDMRTSAIHLLLDTARRVDGGVGWLLPDLRRWAADHPYDDVINSALAESLRRTGRSAEASMHLRTHWARLASDLDNGLAPSVAEPGTQVTGPPHVGLPLEMSHEVSQRLAEAIRGLGEIAQMIARFSSPPPASSATSSRH